jgi:hypothetical protein
MSSYEVRDAEERDLEQLLGLYVDLSEGDFARMPADVEVFRVVLARIISDQQRTTSGIRHASHVVMPSTFGGSQWLGVPGVGKSPLGLSRLVGLGEDVALGGART